jgi:iron complex outermembrane receptor protein
MRKLVLHLLFSIIPSIIFSQSIGSISGKITDKQTNGPLPGATVTIKGTQTSKITNNEGYFKFQKVNAGNIILVISYVGYETTEYPVTIVEGKTEDANISLETDERTGNAVVVSASKRREKITNAPASIQVIGVKDFTQFAGSNVGELVSKVQGVEYTRNGVTDITFNARGFHSAFNNKVFHLVDSRNSMSPLSASLPVMNRGTSTKDDIERLEIIVGPQTALYGPNAHNALFNYITKDPRKYPGTTVSISAGNRDQFSWRIRQAAKIDSKWAYKLTGEYATGKEYDFKDSVYAGNQSPSTYEGNEPPPGSTPYYGPPVAIPERINNFNFRHIRGEGHVYYSVTPNADIIISGGGSKSSWPQVTTGGRNQMRDVSYSFVQARFVSPRFFANIYDTWGSFGSSYGIGGYTRDYWNRTHSTITDPNHPLYNSVGRLPPDSAEMNALRNMFKEKNYRINAEVQYNYQFEKVGLFLVAGMNYQKEMPNGFGNSLIDSFQRIKITQYGGVMQLEKKLPWDMRFITTARLDHHSNFGNFFAPRFALMKSINTGTFRITWGKAYAMPSIQQQYAGINRVLFGNGGEGIYYIPVGTNVHDTSLFKTTTPLKPEQVETWELGFKGTIAKKLYIDINYYNGLSENFISPTRTVRGRVMTVNGTKVTHNPSTAGTVILDTLRNASFSTFFNYAEVRGYGLDLGVTYTFNKFISLAIKYSWFNSDIADDDIKNDANNDGYVSLEETSLNAPNNRGVIILNFQNLCKGRMFINMSARFVEQYDFYSSSQIGTETGEGSRGKVYLGMNPLNGKHRWALKNFDWGPLGGFATVDLGAGYRFNQMVSVNMGITNLLDTYQREFVGSPSIGRLIMFELKVHVPNKNRK